MKLQSAAWSLTVLMLASGAGHAATFVPLGSFEPSPGDTYSEAHAVSADGTIVTGFSRSTTGQFEAFRWTSGTGLVHLGTLTPAPFVSSQGRAISADGTVIAGNSVVTSGTGFDIPAVSWTGSSPAASLGYLPGGTRATAMDASANGSVIVGESLTSGGYRAFLWTSPGGMVDLGALNGASGTSNAYGVSDDGSVVVGLTTSASGVQAFRWTSGTGMSGLGDLAGGSFNSRAFDVSADGTRIVGSGTQAGGDEAFLWTSTGGMVGLGRLGGATAAYGISDDASVIIGGGDIGALVWTSAGIQVLFDVLVAQGATGLTGWTGTTARGISADGRTIVGYGTNPNGKREAWLATWDPQGLSVTPVPLPASFWLIGSALLALRALRRRA